MKKLFFFLIVVPACLFGQGKAYEAEVFNKEILSFDEQKKAYPSLTTPTLNDNKNGIIKFDIETKKLIYDYFKFARQQGIIFSEFKENHYIPVSLCVQPSGQIDYFVWGFFNPRIKGVTIPKDSLNAEDKRIFVKLAEDFIKNYRLPASISQEKFSIGFAVNMGTSTKKESKKFISTIGMAERCDQPDTVKTLMFGKLELTSFPAVVLKFKNVEKLDLSDNYIEHIPKQLWQLKKLKFLSLSNNYIDYSTFRFKKNKHLKDLNLQFTGLNKIPRSIQKNKSLEVLFLGNNLITSFARRDFKKMQTLKALNLYNVRLTQLPINVTKLKNLEELDLYYNEFKQLPDEICAMPKLKTLAVSNNQLWKLPENLSKIQTLKVLYAHHNKLSTLPVLPDLKLLHLSYNLFKEVPKEVYPLANLEEFDISRNEIEEVPVKLVEFKKLQRVYLHGNNYDLQAGKSQELSKLVANLESKEILVR